MKSGDDLCDELKKAMEMVLRAKHQTIDIKKFRVEFEEDRMEIAAGLAARAANSKTVDKFGVRLLENYVEYGAFFLTSDLPATSDLYTMAEDVALLPGPFADLIN